VVKSGDTLVLGTSAFGHESSTLSSATKFFDNAPDAEVDEAADCNPAYRVRVSDGAPNGRDEQLVAPWSRKPAHRKGIGVRIPSLPPNFCGGLAQWHGTALLTRQTLMKRTQVRFLHPPPNG
jgi:hypothetical protein